MSDIRYYLPEERIALYPANPPDSCKLMVVSLPSFKIEDRIFKDIVHYMRRGDVIAVNDSRVIPARLKGRKETGGNVEFLLLEKIDPCTWKALGRPSSRLKEGMEISVFARDGRICSVKICKKFIKGIFIVHTQDNILEYGYVPLPPYIASRRDIVDSDYQDYQTNFAMHDGSVASPTSGLHFTRELIAELKNRGVLFAPVTLHVGQGTFRPNYDTPEPERYELSETSAKVLNQAKRVCVCGTTAMRAVETAFNGKEFIASSGKTDLFIKPGYRFSKIKMFMTNFHLPGTPLLLMVAAYLERFSPGTGSKKVLELYSRAIKKEYRFLSYGDIMLIGDPKEVHFSSEE